MADPNAYYKDPLRDATYSTYRIDAGVDYFPTGPVYALGKARIIQVGVPSNTSTFGSSLSVYELLEGPAKGLRVYFGEHYSVHGTQHVGDIVNANTVMWDCSGGGIEIGWADPNGTQSYAWGRTNNYLGSYWDAHHTIEGVLTGVGENFSDLLKALGARPGQRFGHTTKGGLPNIFPSWSGSPSPVLTGDGPSFKKPSLSNIAALNHPGINVITRPAFFGLHGFKNGPQEPRIDIVQVKVELENPPKHWDVEHKGDYYNALFESHEIAVDVILLDQAEQEIGYLSSNKYPIISGQIDIDTSAAISRQLSVDFAVPHPADFQEHIWGPKGAAVDVDGSSKGPFHPARYVVVRYYVKVDRPKGQRFPGGTVGGGTQAWVGKTVFWGVPTHVTADEAKGVLHIEAQSKEVLLTQPVTTRFTKSTFGVGKEIISLANTPDQKFDLYTFVTDVLQSYGELHALESDHEGLNITFDPQHDVLFTGLMSQIQTLQSNGIWQFLQKTCNDLGFNLFYNAYGHPVIRSMPTGDEKEVAAIVTNNPPGYKGGPPSNVITFPAVGWDFTKWVNQIVLTFGASGPQGFGSHHPGAVVLYEDFKEQGSMRDLERNGVLRGMTQWTSLPVNMPEAQAEAIGLRQFREAENSAMQFEVEILPIPHLELHDHVGVWLTDFDGHVYREVMAPNKWSLPLTPKTSTMGFNAPVRVVTKTYTQHMPVEPGTV